VETLPPRLPPMARPRRPGRAARLQGDACGTWSARLSPPRARAPSGAPLGRRGGAAGKRAGQPGMGWRGGEPAPPHTTRQRAACPCGAGLTRDFGQPPAGDTAEASRGPPAGAVFPKAGAWPALKGPPAHRLVRRLQGRIVQAPQAGRWGQGRALQRLLPHACAAKSLAVTQVTAPRGTWPPGVAGGLWETPEPQAPAVPSLGQQGSRPRPWRRGALPTSTGTGTRPRARPWRQDRARPALSLGARAPLAAPLGASHASGCRRARATADASAPGQRGLALSASAPWRVAGDLRAGCAGGAHDGWGAPRPLAKAILRPGRYAGCLAPPLLAPTETGVPPGGGSAPVSMSLARPGVARPRTGAVPPCQGPHRTKVHGSRLAEACLSTGTATGCLAPAVQPRVAPGLAARGLARARADAGHAQGGGG
jgi:hypothetical protein